MLLDFLWNVRIFFEYLDSVIIKYSPLVNASWKLLGMEWLNFISNAIYNIDRIYWRKIKLFEKVKSRIKLKIIRDLLINNLDISEE
jgi:hypothetical protein